MLHVEIKEKEGLMKDLEDEVLAKEKAIETEKKKTACLSCGGCGGCLVQG